MKTLFELISNNTKYFRWYESICERAFGRELPLDTYTETHHILPKSIFPAYDKDPLNLVKLTAREHFVCHWLLTKIIPNNPKIIYAFQMMIPNKSGKRYSPKSSIVYQNLKIKFSKNNKPIASYSWYTNGDKNILLLKNSEIPIGFYPGRTFNQKHKDSLKGIPKSQEQKQKQSVAMKGKPGIVGSKNPAKRQEVKDKIRQSRIGSKASEETKLKMKLSRLGKKRGPYKRSSPHPPSNAD